MAALQQAALQRVGASQLLQGRIAPALRPFKYRAAAQPQRTGRRRAGVRGHRLSQAAQCGPDLFKLKTGVQ
jgi:hypothetical protein